MRLRRKKDEKKQKEADFKGDPRFTPGYGYKETDPYIFLGNGTVISCFDVLFQYGTNNPAELGWLINLIPQTQITNGKIYFVEREKGMDKGTEDSITQKRLASNLNTINSSNTNDAKQVTKNSRRIEDLKESAILSGEEDTVVDSDVILVIKAKRPKDIEITIEKIKEIYRDNKIKGVMLVRKTGDQLRTLQTLLTETASDSWHSSDMSTTAATRLFYPSSGFSDKHGVFIGTDAMALIQDNPSVIDFGNIRNAVVYMGDVVPVASMGGYDGGGLIANGGSAVANIISDGNYLRGRRTHHILLSDFDYQKPDSLYFNMSKESINPLEVFGTKETVQQDANATFDKVTDMILLMSKSENNIYLKTRLNKLIVDWFINSAKGNGMYTDDPVHNPPKAQRILATERHDQYPTLVDFLTQLQINMGVSKKEGEKSFQDARFLYEQLDTAFKKYPNVFARETTLPDIYQSGDRNIYYDLSKVGEDKRLTGIMFLNLLAYVTYRALAGEQIVIHGLDQIDIPLESLLIYKDRIKRKNIGLITVYEHKDNKINPISFEKFSGQLSRQDMVVLGGLSEKDVSEFGKSWQQSLPTTVSNQLLASNDGILYFYRKSDRIGALVNTHLIL